MDLKKWRAFTMVEVMLIVIVLGILASIAIARFVGMSKVATERTEDYLIGNMQESVGLVYSKNVTDGNNVWPSDNPFNLLDKAPPNKSATEPADGVKWRHLQDDSVKAWFIMCPHWDGDNAGGGGTKGRFYIYQYADSSASWKRNPGDLFLYVDKGH